MKKPLLHFLCAFMLICLLIAGRARAQFLLDSENMEEEKKVEFNVGIGIWYAWWAPFFKDYISGNKYPDYRNRFSADMKGALMLGPSYIFKFNNGWRYQGAIYFNIGSNYRFSQSNAGIDINILAMSPDVYYGKSGIDFKKIETDQIILYEYSRHVTFYGIIKVCFNDGESGLSRAYVSTTNLLMNYNYILWTMAPGFGVENSINIIGNLFFISQTAFLLAPGELRQRQKIISPSYIVKWKGFYRIMSYGMTIHPSISYFISPVRLRLSLGFKYQFFHVFEADRKMSPYDKLSDPDLLDNRVDHFYGVTFSLLYAF